MNYYFMDFENVHSDGFAGVETLSENDTMYLMFTEHCKMLSIEALEKICRRKINLEVFRVGSGTKNALDFQLSSFMGYVIAKNEGKDNAFYIVSKDTGFNPLIDFWKEKGIEVKIIPNFLPNGSSKQVKSKAKNVKTDTAESLRRVLSAAQDSAKAGNTKAAVSAPKKEADTNEKPRTAKVKKKPDINAATKEELLACLSEAEYSDKILEIINSYKTKMSIKNGLDKEFRDSQKSSVIYKKLKSLLKEKKKT